MLEKSLLTSADSIAYDLEDSVTPAKKVEARAAVAEFMDVRNLSSALHCSSSDKTSSAGAQ